MKEVIMDAEIVEEAQKPKALNYKGLITGVISGLMLIAMGAIATSTIAKNLLVAFGCLLFIMGLFSWINPKKKA